MPDEKVTWNEFYKRIAGREARPLLLRALELFSEPSGLQAVDLGCGDGTETALLLSRGWNVLAIDSEPTSMDYLLKKVSDADSTRLQTQVAKFEELVLPPADLIHASYSLPFCHPQHFPALWEKIKQALTPGGRFAGEFFGVHDTWADNSEMNFHTEADVRKLLNGLETEYFKEEDEDGESTSGPKHWHVFSVIARKV